MKIVIFALVVVLSGAWTAPVRADEADIADLVEQQHAAGVQLATQIWQWAEVGYQETRSSAALQSYLQQQGFEVQAGVADIPTAFVATGGTDTGGTDTGSTETGGTDIDDTDTGATDNKGPTIGILAEFDALPGLSQMALPSREPRVADAAGHACGHHLFGAASVTAAVAVNQWLQTAGENATIKVFGTPAEEGGSGKVYLARAGLFDDVDIMLHWHPASSNSASPSTTTANKSGRFTFRGKSAHAAAAPERGRSALDGVEAMNFMVNMMREHVPQTTRIHYIITDGGDAPNIVPEQAQVYYYVRHPQVEMVVQLFERVVNAAQAAAMGTETSMDFEVMHGNYPLLPNRTLAKMVDANMRELGGISYSPAENKFAGEIHKTLLNPNQPLGSQETVLPFQFRQTMGSTDVGDVSWLVPTAGFNAATWVPGTPAHSWQAVAAGGMSIGHQGMLLAAKVLAQSAVDLVRSPSLIKEAKAELNKSRGEDFNYVALLGDRLPPLDYRR